jgi:sulfur carrier protein
MNDAKIKINGVVETLSADTLAILLARMGIDPAARGVAAARNGAVVPRGRWAETALQPGDEVEIIKAMSGG